MNNFIKKNIKWIILFIGIIIFLLIARIVFKNDIVKLDVLGYKYVSKFISSKMTSITRVFTNVGGALFLIGLTIILFFSIKNKRIGLIIALNLGLSALLNNIFKIILQRPRPTEYVLVNERGYSFPSGHSMVSMAYYGLLIYLIYKYVKNKYLKTFLIVLLSLLILGIGLSRIYLGVHYTTDVLAGFIFSISYLILYIHIVNKFVFKNVKR